MCSIRIEELVYSVAKPKYNLITNVGREDVICG